MAYNKMAQFYRSIFMDNIDSITEKYNNGETIKQISKEYDISYKFCSEKIIELGLKTPGKRKLSINESYFSSIDTPNKAYILGLWYADGCNQIRNTITGNGKYHVCISLQKSDIDILYQIKKELKYDGKISKLNRRDSVIDGRTIKKENCQGQYSLDIYSKKISLDLERHGVIQNKSLKLTFPKSLDESLYSHFIRGYFDGDGSIIYTSYKYIWKIVSTKDFCESVKKIIESKFNIKLSMEYNIHNNGVTSVVRSQDKTNVKRIMDWLYEDAELYLKRKYNYYNNIYNINNSLSA